MTHDVELLASLWRVEQDDVQPNEGTNDDHLRDR